MQIQVPLLCFSLFLFSWISATITSKEHDRCVFHRDQSITKVTLDSLFLPKSGDLQFLLQCCTDCFKIAHFYKESFFSTLRVDDLNTFILAEEGLLIIFQNYIPNILEDGPEVLLIPYSILKSFMDPQDPIHFPLNCKISQHDCLSKINYDPPRNGKIIEYDEKTICFLEEQLPELFEAAVKQAYWQALASGGSVLISRDGALVEIFPDGTERVIKELPTTTLVIPGQILKIQ